MNSKILIKIGQKELDIEAIYEDYVNEVDLSQFTPNPYYYEECFSEYPNELFELDILEYIRSKLVNNKKITYDNNRYIIQYWSTVKEYLHPLKERDDSDWLDTKYNAIHSHNIDILGINELRQKICQEIITKEKLNLS